MNTLDYILKKYNIEVGHQYFIDIPEIKGGVGLAKLFEEIGLKDGAEIGTDQGEFAEALLKVNPKLGLNCIDPWKASAYEKGEQPESGEAQEFFDKRFMETLGRLQKFGDRWSLIKKTSMEALENFEDNSLDFVYIDGNHDFLNVTQDIHFWKDKVRSGGIISGHDYAKYPFHKYNHVKKVVQAYATSYNLLPVFATAQDREGLKRDRFRSWFIVKP